MKPLYGLIWLISLCDPFDQIESKFEEASCSDSSICSRTISNRSFSKIRLCWITTKLKPFFLNNCSQAYDVDVNAAILVTILIWWGCLSRYSAQVFSIFKLALKHQYVVTLWFLHINTTSDISTCLISQRKFIHTRLLFFHKNVPECGNPNKISSMVLPDLKCLFERFSSFD